MVRAGTMMMMYCIHVLLFISTVNVALKLMVMVIVPSGGALMADKRYQ